MLSVQGVIEFWVLKSNVPKGQLDPILFTQFSRLIFNKELTTMKVRALQAKEETDWCQTKYTS